MNIVCFVKISSIRKGNMLASILNHDKLVFIKLIKDTDNVLLNDKMKQ